jgi:hypothetical protein
MLPARLAALIPAPISERAPARASIEGPLQIAPSAVEPSRKRYKQVALRACRRSEQAAVQPPQASMLFELELRAAARTPGVACPVCPIHRITNGAIADPSVTRVAQFNFQGGVRPDGTHRNLLISDEYDLPSVFISHLRRMA